MLCPKKTKYRKFHKGRIKGKSKNGFLVSFGSFALIALQCGRLSAKQIEAARIVMNRHVKKNGKLWIRVFPDRPITKKPAEIRMGKGKGPVEEWVSVVKPGRVLYEIDGVHEAIARKSMKLAQAKIPIPTKFILKDNDFVH